MEITELWQTLIRGGAVMAYAFLYAMGGTSGFHKIIRRLGSPIVFIVFMLFLKPVGWEHLSLLALIPPLWLGYGGGEYETRVVYACISGLCGGFVCFMFGNNGMAVFQCLLTIFATTYLGVLNPIHARREEFLIGALSVIGVAFTI